jgi:hypothetical protein
MFIVFTDFNPVTFVLFVVVAIIEPYRYRERTTEAVLSPIFLPQLFKTKRWCKCYPLLCRVAD